MNIPSVIDFEASGFGKGSYPIEVGYVTSASASWCSLIIPKPEWVHWTPEAESIHQITRELLFKHGRTPLVVARKLNQTFANTTVYSDAWLHDYIWMSTLFEAADMSPRFKLEDFRNILTPYQERCWEKTKIIVQNELNHVRHRASNDAKVLQLTWIRTKYLEEIETKLSTLEST